jgi:hypothetical protein
MSVAKGGPAEDQVGMGLFGVAALLCAISAVRALTT